ncbi:hypothetical protein CDD80_4398 [Ophiocordyceps camponoti-rufipedis]|uniref:Uncharacterized protein n=1 Tax=Ophiocordyceps camponoti-rufipedis TaxID=2004952 RepID=A0A2C5YY01_9HYPO|nr:hypothetical protein CDD80_4398 [Ophiocordyceps camponoti-rufipedis]
MSFYQQQLLLSTTTALPGKPSKSLGADARLRNKTGFTPLELAIIKGHTKVAKLLIGSWVPKPKFVIHPVGDQEFKLQLGQVLRSCEGIDLMASKLRGPVDTFLKNIMFQINHGKDKTVEEAEEKELVSSRAISGFEISSTKFEDGSQGESSKMLGEIVEKTCFVLRKSEGHDLDMVKVGFFQHLALKNLLNDILPRIRYQVKGSGSPEQKPRKSFFGSTGKAQKTSLESQKVLYVVTAIMIARQVTSSKKEQGKLSQEKSAESSLGKSENASREAPDYRDEEISQEKDKENPEENLKEGDEETTKEEEAIKGEAKEEDGKHVKDDAEDGIEDNAMKKGLGEAKEEFDQEEVKEGVDQGKVKREEAKRAIEDTKEAAYIVAVQLSKIRRGWLEDWNFGS